MKCKHCMEFLDESKRPYGSGVMAAATDGVPWYCKTSSIILTFVMVPPLALPLIWLHPKLGLLWKIVLTVATGLLCWGMYRTFVEFIHQFDEATKMFEEMKM